ncbi:MAG: site-2 protease family protein [Candidatus Paceibacterota bacterium]
MQEINFIFSIAILIMSVVIHEVSHGFMANHLGDPTAKYEGRLTLNPFKHLDFFGSFLVPLITYMAGGFVFGWAKPVPYNPYNLKNPKVDAGLVAAAGPASNFIIALFFGLILRFGQQFAFIPTPFMEIVSLIVLINIILGIFNLVPVPPLDGSKVLFSFLPSAMQGIMNFLERFGFFFLLIIIFFFSGWILPIVSFLFRLITGTGF